MFGNLRNHVIQLADQYCQKGNDILSFCCCYCTYVLLENSEFFYISIFHCSCCSFVVFPSPVYFFPPCFRLRQPWSLVGIFHCRNIIYFTPLLKFSRELLKFIGVILIKCIGKLGRKDVRNFPYSLVWGNLSVFGQI
jgi:hypothetical protein